VTDHQVAQVSLVNSLCMTMALEIGEAVSESKIPEEWDGHELREYIAELAARLASRSLINKKPRSARARAFHSHVRTTTL